MFVEAKPYCNTLTVVVNASKVLVSGCQTTGFIIYTSPHLPHKIKTSRTEAAVLLGNGNEERFRVITDPVQEIHRELDYSKNVWVWSSLLPYTYPSGIFSVF